MPPTSYMGTATSGYSNMYEKEYYTHWTDVFPMLKMEGTAVAKINIEHVICRYTSTFQMRSKSTKDANSNVNGSFEGVGY